MKVGDGLFKCICGQLLTPEGKLSIGLSSHSCLGRLLHLLQGAAIDKIKKAVIFSLDSG